MARKPGFEVCDFFGLRVDNRLSHATDLNVCGVSSQQSLRHRDGPSMVGDHLPGTVLLDEPFSGLDRHLKSEVRQTLMGALRAAGAAVLMVTHDAEEALLMADDLALMDKGRILQTGAPEEAYLQPVSPAAARLLGEAELLAAEVRAGVATTAFGALPAPGAPDGPAWVMTRPGDAFLSTEGAAATVVAVAFGGPFIEVKVHVAGQTLRLRTTGSPPSIGEAIRVALDADRLRLYPRA